MPEIKYTTGVVNVGGEGLISVQMDFSALRKDTDGGTDQSALEIDTLLLGLLRGFCPLQLS